MIGFVNLTSFNSSAFKKLSKTFKCTPFNELEKHIKQYAYKHSKDGLFQTYLLKFKDKFIGYISFSNISIDGKNKDINIDTLKDILNISKSFTYPIPALKITRLCVFDDFQRYGFGSIFLEFSYLLGFIQQYKLGCKALVVDSKKEAISFYQKFGFINIDLESDSDNYFMIKQIKSYKEDILQIEDLKGFSKKHNLSGEFEILGEIEKRLNSPQSLLSYPH